MVGFDFVSARRPGRTDERVVSFFRGLTNVSELIAESADSGESWGTCSLIIEVVSSDASQGRSNEVGQEKRLRIRFCGRLTLRYSVSYPRNFTLPDLQKKDLEEAFVNRLASVVLGVYNSSTATTAKGYQPQQNSLTGRMITLNEPATPLETGRSSRVTVTSAFS